MATLEMTCVVPNCDMGDGAPYKTEKVDVAMAWNMLQVHIAHAHQAVVHTDPVREVRPQAERVKRPTLTLSSVIEFIKSVPCFASFSQFCTEQISENILSR